MSKKEELAREYSNKKVKDKALYPLNDMYVRRKLTTFDAYELEDAFEAGWNAAINKACEWLKEKCL